MNREVLAKGLLSASPKLWATLEWCLCGAATLIAVGLHLLYLNHAGGLWRDEAGSLGLATLPSWGQMWRMIGHDSFPALYFSLVRCWCGLGWGGSDFGLRCLGFLVGLLVVASLWGNARVFRLGTPTISLGLLALNATLLRWGDSLRAYGLGCLFIMLTFGAVWLVVRSPSRGRFVLASLAGILSVQTLYQNAFLLLAICAAGFLVCVRRQRPRAGLNVLAIGVPAAVSLLPYLGTIRHSQDWYVVAKSGFLPNVVFPNLLAALGSPFRWIAFIWMGLAGLAVAGGIVSFRKMGKLGQPGSEDMSLFASLTLVLGVLFFFVFLWVSQLLTQPWYWLPVVCLAAVCLDVAVRGWLGGPSAWSLVCLLLLICVLLPRAITLDGKRQTNIDLVAAWTTRMAKPGDLIVVYPWNLGISFQRYYKGAASWTTIPEISDLSLHRYDLLKARMAEKAPIAPILERVGQTLRSGNAIWLVGLFPLAKAGEGEDMDIPPAPASRYGWWDFPYLYMWGRQTVKFVSGHARLKGVVVPVSSNDQISEFENAPVVMLRQGPPHD